MTIIYNGFTFHTLHGLPYSAHSEYFFPPWKIDGPEFLDNVERTVIILLGLSTLPICLGGHEFCLKLYLQQWEYNVANGLGFLIGLFALSP